MSSPPPAKKPRITETTPEKQNTVSKTFDDVQIINDPIHGVIELHPLLSKIINTRQFQRLKDIKQLGVSYWIFPGASHNRFEHCIGTSYLCGKMIDTLRNRHSTEDNGKIEITEVESLCVKVAGLCHDLGHGPFSHFFDKDYIPRVRKEGPKWTHEQASCDLFDFMLQENEELNGEFKKYRLEEAEKIFIKDLILGEKSEESKEKMSTIVYEEVVIPDKKKSFLYEIVNNKRNGIDCDKFDYFARDCHNVGVQSNFDWQRYFFTTRIMPVKDELQICVRDKEVFNLYELFHTRSSLHQRVYQHKTEAPIKDMLAEALSKVDEVFKISESIANMGQYTNLTDSIIYDICRSDSSDPQTKEAKDLLLKIQNRQLYKLCGETYLPAARLPDETKKEIEDEIKEEIQKSFKDSLSPDKVFTSITVVGRKKDPIESVNFFNKSGDIIKFPKEQLEQMRPASMTKQVHVARVYAKSHEYAHKVKECFQNICEDKNYPTVEICPKSPSKLPQTPEKDRSPRSQEVEKIRRNLMDDDLVSGN